MVTEPQLVEIPSRGPVAQVAQTVRGLVPFYGGRRAAGDGSAGSIRGLFQSSSDTMGS